MVEELKIKDQQLHRMVGRARRFAAEAHIDQRYGRCAYTAHLQDVESVLIRFGHIDETLLSAAWLHDVWNDCPTVFKYRLQIQFPSPVVVLILAVSEPGTVYSKILVEGVRAIILKLAERIAQAEFWLKEGSAFIDMYRMEYPAFRAVLYKAGDEDAMWNHLDSLMAA